MSRHTTREGYGAMQCHQMSHGGGLKYKLKTHYALFEWPLQYWFLMFLTTKVTSNAKEIV